VRLGLLISAFLSGYIKLYQLISGEFSLCHGRSDYDRLNQVTSG